MAYVNTGIFSFLAALALGLTVSLIAYQAGYAVLSRAGIFYPKLNRHETILFSLATGYAVVSLSVLLLGLAGFLTFFGVMGVLSALALAAYLSIRSSAAAEARGRLFPKLKRWDILPLFLIALPLFLSLINTAAPPVGNDALAYHLAYPQQFIESHRISYIPFTRDSLWPFGQEMLFTLGMILQGTTLAQAFHWLFYGLTAWAVYSFALRFYNRRIGVWAALIFLFTPVAFAQSSEAYVDLTLTFYVFLAFYGFSLNFDGVSQNKSALLAGIFCGAALATKFLALDAFVALLLCWAILTRVRPKPLFIFLGVSALMSGIWYLRSWIILGNPVYPVFSQVFGGHGYASGMDDMKGMGVGALSFLLLPWNATMLPGNFGGEYLGPLFLMFVPILPFLNRFRMSEMPRYMTFYVLVYTVLMFGQAQHMRYFLSIAPFLALGASVSLHKLSKRGPLLKRIGWAVLGLVITLHSLIFIYRTRNTWPVLLGWQSKEAYLLRHERSYQGYLYLKEHFQKEPSIFNSGESRIFYSPFKMVTDSGRLPQHLRQTGLTVTDYLEREKFDVIWLGDTEEDKRLAGFIRSQGYRLQHSYSFTEKPTSFDFEIYSR